MAHLKANKNMEHQKKGAVYVGSSFCTSQNKHLMNNYTYSISNVEAFLVCTEFGTNPEF